MKGRKLYVSQGDHSKLSCLKIGEFRGNQGEPIVNVHTQHKIKRKRRAGATVDIVTEPENKLYSMSFLKRRRMHDHLSVPKGYI